MENNDLVSILIPTSPLFYIGITFLTLGIRWLCGAHKESMILACWLEEKIPVGLNYKIHFILTDNSLSEKEKLIRTKQAIEQFIQKDATEYSFFKLFFRLRLIRKHNKMAKL